METMRSMASFLLGIAAFIGVVIGAFFVFTLGARAAEVVAPYAWGVALVLFFINLLALLAAIIPSARNTVGTVLFLSSYVYGLAGWLYGLLVTLALWGWLAIIIGIMLGGIGVIPIGMLASIFHGRWDILLTLLLLVVVTYGTRAIAIILFEHHGNRGHEEVENVIELEAKENTQRSWKDLA